MTNILVTGATGFVGSALCKEMQKSAHTITALVRYADAFDAQTNIIEGDLDSIKDYETVLSNIDVVIHLAGRAHILKETESDSYEAFAAVNVRGTEQLVTAAAHHGVKRFIFMSTTKVCGELTHEYPFDELSAIAPKDDYAKTKAIAEGIIQKVCAESKMEYVIIRPPLVYGPNVKANFQRLLSISRSALPMPFGGIRNQRSMVYIRNLVDFVQLCVDHPEAANEIFFVSDDEDLSIADLLQCLAKLQGCKTLLLPIPPILLKMVLNVMNSGLYTKLCENLQVDIGKAKAKLGWKPPYSVQQGLKDTVKAS